MHALAFALCLAALASSAPPAQPDLESIQKARARARSAHGELSREQGGAPEPEAKRAAPPAAEAEPRTSDDIVVAEHGEEEPPAREEMREHSKRLIKGGAAAIAREVAILILEHRHIKSIVFNLPVTITVKHPAKLLDTANKVYTGVGEAEEYSEQNPEQSAGQRALAGSMMLSFEFLMPAPVKIAYGFGKIAMGTSQLAFDEFTSQYLEARSNRLLMDKGGFWERYSNFRAEGTTPFYLWGVAKERGLKEDLSNLTEVFKSPGDLTQNWDRYVAFMRSFGGRQGGAVRADFDEETARARDILLEEWSAQVRMELARAVKDFADQELPGIEEATAREMAVYARAMRDILQTRSRVFKFHGKVRGLDAAALKDKGLLLLINGAGIPKYEAIRTKGELGADGTYTALVTGILPDMTTVTGFASQDGPNATYRHTSQPAALPVFPALFRLFDNHEWDKIQRPAETVELDLVFDECADLDPAGKGLDKGRFTEAFVKYQKCRKEGPAAAQSPAGSGSPDEAKKQCVACVNALVGGSCYVRMATMAGWGLCRSCSADGGVAPEDRFIESQRCPMCAKVRWDLCDFKPAPKNCVAMCKPEGSCPNRDKK